MSEEKTRFLTSLCETRFIERHISIVTFRQLLKYVLHCLSQIKSWSSLHASKQACSLENIICSSEFIIGLILDNLSSLILPLLRVLQKFYGDLVQALDVVNNLMSTLNGIRSEDAFGKIINKAKSMGVNFIQITKLRTPSGFFRSRSAAEAKKETQQTITASSIQQLML